MIFSVLMGELAANRVAMVPGKFTYYTMTTALAT